MTHCSLIYDETSHSPAPATARYGLCLVLAGLLPTLAAVLHLPRAQVSCHWSRRSIYSPLIGGEGAILSSDWSTAQSKARLWARLGLSVLFFPLVPAYFYLQLILRPSKVSPSHLIIC